MISACNPLASKIFHWRAAINGRQQIVLSGYATLTLFAASCASRNDAKKKTPARTIDVESLLPRIDVPFGHGRPYISLSLGKFHTNTKLTKGYLADLCSTFSHTLTDCSGASRPCQRNRRGETVEAVSHPPLKQPARVEITPCLCKPEFPHERKGPRATARNSIRRSPSQPCPL